MIRYLIRSYLNGDEVRIAGLYYDIFGHRTTPDEWKWKYLDCPQGCSVFIAHNHDDLYDVVGHNGFQSKKGWYKGKIYTFYIAGDVLIKKEYRHQGFVIKTLRSLPRGNYVVYAFTSSVSPFGSYGTLVHVPILKIDKNYFFKKGTSKLKIREFMVGVDEVVFDEFWEKKKEEVEFAVIRDYVYIKWRFINAPNKKKIYFLVEKDLVKGYFVISIKNDVCYLVDILILEECQNESVLSDMVGYLFSLGINYIDILISDKDIILALKRVGFNVCGSIPCSYHNEIERGVPVTLYLTYSDMDQDK